MYCLLLVNVSYITIKSNLLTLVKVLPYYLIHRKFMANVLISGRELFSLALQVCFGVVLNLRGVERI